MKPYLLSGAMCLLLALAGCGGSVVQKRGGAYYKDDGPSDNIPVNLDSIPDAQPRLEPLHRAANRPYVVLGKSYVPGTTLKPMRQRGVASWYGKKFHGKKTSIGEPYDMFAMTAAHTTLPLPSYARVTNLNNGKSVVVRVIDRGPFHANRIIDLSYAAAYRLGYINSGSAMVEVRTVLPNETNPPVYAAPRTPVLPVKPVAAATPAAPAAPPVPAAKPEREEFELFVTQLAEAPSVEPAPAEPVSAAGGSRGVFLQLGAFSSADNAENLRAHLMQELDWLTESIQIQTGDGVYRVHLGPYERRENAEEVARKIRVARGFWPSFVIR
jgi:rare lipoprotein A